MEESYSDKEQPAWQDISLAEIKELLAEGATDRALFLARLRYTGIRSIPTEIDRAIEQSGTIDPELWRAERTALEQEIQELEQLLNEN